MRLCIISQSGLSEEVSNGLISSASAEKEPAVRKEKQLQSPVYCVSCPDIHSGEVAGH